MGVSIIPLVLRSLSGCGVEMVSQLLQLDGNVDIPGIGAKGREIFRFLQMAAACRLEETVGC